MRNYKREWNYKSQSNSKFPLLVSLILLAFLFSTHRFEVENTWKYYIDTSKTIVSIERNGASYIFPLELLAKCESSNNPLAVNNNEPHGKSYGLLQFRIDTFNHFGERYGLPHDDIFNEEQQKAIALEMFKEGRLEHWETCITKMLPVIDK